MQEEQDQVLPPHQQDQVEYCLDPHAFHYQKSHVVTLVTFQVTSGNITGAYMERPAAGYI